jgi:hypothetical protein
VGKGRQGKGKKGGMDGWMGSGDVYALVVGRLCGWSVGFGLDGDGDGDEDGDVKGGAVGSLSVMFGVGWEMR